MGLCHHKSDAEQHESRAGIIDWEEVQRVHCHKEADGADEAGATAPGLRNSKISP